MALQGSLRDMAAAELIQHVCQDGRRARLVLESGGRRAELFIEAGQVVHATQGERQGEEVVFDLMGWADGSFVVDSDVPPPARSVERSYAGLLLEGARRLDESADAPTAESPAAQQEPADPTEPAQEGRMGEPTLALSSIEGVAGAVLVAEDGVIIAHTMQGDPEKEGAVAAFVGAAALQAGEALGLGGFQRGTVVISTGSLLILKHGAAYAGLLLDEGASPALVASRAEALLKEQA